MKEILICLIISIITTSIIVLKVEGGFKLDKLEYEVYLWVLLFSAEFSIVLVGSLIFTTVVKNADYEMITINEEEISYVSNDDPVITISNNPDYNHTHEQIAISFKPSNNGNLLKSLETEKIENIDKNYSSIIIDSNIENSIIKIKKIRKEPTNKVLKILDNLFYVYFKSPPKKVVDITVSNKDNIIFENK